jgi:molybdenum cofactor cytidylyltransferase
MPASDCAAIVLAAGASTRLGQPKQLVQLDGEALLHRAARLALEAGCSPVIVVLGFEAERMQQALNGLQVRTVVNPEWQSGMASSLRCGIEEVEQNDPERVLLLLSDQPCLSIDVLQALLQKSDESHLPITASHYANTLGVPAIFHRELFSELKNIEGDKGARQVIERHRSHAISVDFMQGAVDIDTPADLRAFQSSLIN